MLILGHFCPLLSIYTCVPKTTIIWCIIPEIPSETDIIFCHFGSFFALLHPPPLPPMISWIKILKQTEQPKKLKFWKTEKPICRYYYFTHVYNKWQSYDVWFLRYGAWRTQFFVILDCFLPLYPPNNPKNQNFEKMKKNIWIYYHFTHIYHKW